MYDRSGLSWGSVAIGVALGLFFGPSIQSILHGLAPSIFPEAPASTALGDVGMGMYAADIMPVQRYPGTGGGGRNTFAREPEGALGALDARMFPHAVYGGHGHHSLYG